jgi:hypothetical protein
MQVRTRLELIAVTQGAFEAILDQIFSFHSIPCQPTGEPQQLGHAVDQFFVKIECRDALPIGWRDRRLKRG